MVDWKAAYSAVRLVDSKAGEMVERWAAKTVEPRVTQWVAESGVSWVGASAASKAGWRVDATADCSGAKKAVDSAERSVDAMVEKWAVQRESQMAAMWAGSLAGPMAERTVDVSAGAMVQTSVAWLAVQSAAAMAERMVE